VEPAKGNGVTSTSGSLSSTGGAGRRPWQQGDLAGQSVKPARRRHKERARAAEVLAGERPAALPRPIAQASTDRARFVIAVEKAAQQTLSFTHHPR